MALAASPPALSPVVVPVPRILSVARARLAAARPLSLQPALVQRPQLLSR